MSKTDECEVGRLSYAQMYALYLGMHYKLVRLSEGWWAENHRDNKQPGSKRQGRTIRPSTITSLWQRGFLDGVHDAGEEKRELQTNDRGQRLLANIMNDTGLFFNLETDELTQFAYWICPEDLLRIKEQVPISVLQIPINTEADGFEMTITLSSRHRSDRAT